MPAFNVYLGEVCTTNLSQTQKNEVQSALTTWFGQICNSTSYTPIVSWINSAPATIQNNELLVYFVATTSDSVIRHMPGYNGGAGQSDGFTFFTDNLHASEVYVSRSSGWLAEIAFHELMHNKLHLRDAALHARTGLARVPVSAGSQPSGQNITQMRAALAASRPQWANAWSSVTCPDPNDPLFGL